MNPVYDPMTNERLGDEYIVGKPESVRALMKLMNVPVDERGDDYHRLYGRALGYHPAAVEEFILAAKSGVPYADNKRIENIAKSNALGVS
jgi:hypothetical protein